MTNIHKTFTLITGASDGLGAAFAKLFADQGHNLILVARRGDRLRQLARDIGDDITIHIIVQDLSDPGAAQKLYKRIRRQKLHVDQLVNNAGVGYQSLFSRSDTGSQEQMIGVNVTAITMLTYLILPDMIKHKHGRILNIASVAAFAPLPYMSVYGATKSYVLSFSQGLHEELRGSGVTVTCLCPGTFKSGFSHVAKASRRSPLTHTKTSPRTIATHGYRAMQEGMPVAIPGIRNKLFVHIITRLSPRAWIRRVMALAMRP